MRFCLINNILLFFFTAISSFSFSQDFNTYCNFKHLNVENGLSQNIVYHFLQDSRGYMWMGTYNGLTRYDGVRTIKFMHDDQNKNSISDNYITRILEDSNHLIWIGSNSGIDLFHTADNSFTHFGIGMQGGRSENTYCMPLGFSDKYNLWLIDTKSKAIKIFNTLTKDFKKVINTDAVDGNLYVNSLSGMLHIWTYLSNGTTHYQFQNTTLVKEEHFFKDEKRMQIFHVFYQNDSSIWLSTVNGLIGLNPQTRKYKIYNKLGKESISELRYVALSPKGWLWIGTGRKGIYTFDLKTKKFIDNFRNSSLDPYSICSNNIVSVYFDREGNIWCGSYGSGVSYSNIENRFFEKHLSKNELDKWKKQNDISWLGKDEKGNVWCLLRDVASFILLDSSLKIKEYRLPKIANGEFFNGSIYQLCFDSKFSAWCMTDRGLYHYNTVSNTMKRAEYPRLSKGLFGSYWLNFMIRLHDGSFLFATWGGLYRITYHDNKPVIRAFSELNRLPYISFDMVFEDMDKTLYITDHDGKLYILKSDGNMDNYRLIKIIKTIPYGKQYFETDSLIYIATNSGLYQIRKQNLSIQKTLINYTLPFSEISGIIMANKGAWIFGNKGIYYTDFRNNSRLFTVEDGLPSNNFSELSMLLDSSGKCIAGTNNGLVSFYPEKLSDVIYPPRAQLINMYLNDSTKSFLPNPQEISKVTLTHAQNTFSFDFSCISFHHVDACNYEYKLEGFDENWIRSGVSHYTRYSKIPPGNYNFRLRVIDAKGNISPYTKNLLIEIKKAFWQTTTFKFVIAVIALFIIWLVIKWYLAIKIQKHQREFEKQQAIERERTRIATDMHDDLGAGLSSIRFLSEKVKRNTFSDITKNDIDKILVSSSELIDKMNEIVWAMNEKNDTLADLLIYIRSYAKEYCEENDISCEIDIPENIPSDFVSGEVRRNVFLTIKESLHNIVKHAEATKVRIEFQVLSGFSIIIRDNGKGFDRNAYEVDPIGNGLKNMQKRMESIGGKFSIFGDRGTIIEIKVPILYN